MLYAYTCTSIDTRISACVVEPQGLSHDYEDTLNEMPVPKSGHVEYINPVQAKNSKQVSNFLKHIKDKIKHPINKIDDRTKSVEIESIPQRLVCEPSTELMREKNSFANLKNSK